MVLVQSLLVLLKKPLLTLLLIIQLTVMCLQVNQSYTELWTINTHVALLNSLQTEDETVIVVSAMTSREELDSGAKRSVAVLEQLLSSQQIIVNKVYITGGRMTPDDFPEIPTQNPDYQSTSASKETEILISSQPLKGDVKFSGGGNFTADDFNAPIAPVILGTAYASVHKIGDVFEVDMRTGGGLGMMKVQVKGFLEERTLQPILTNFLSHSTDNFNNYFIIGMLPTTHTLFNAPSYIIKTSDAMYQQLQHEVYQLGDKRYTIQDEFSYKKRERTLLVQQQVRGIGAIAMYIVITVLTYYILALQLYQNQKKQHKAFQLVGATPQFIYQYFSFYFVLLVFLASVSWQMVMLYYGQNDHFIVTVISVGGAVLLGVLPVIWQMRKVVMMRNG
ncbi:MAG: hypothetical protein ACRC6X_02485 [Culicoidibacterales bacterium]